MNEREQVLAKGIRLSGALLRSFPVLPAEQHSGYLPDLVFKLLQLQVLPLELVAPLRYVVSVIQQLTQGQYVDTSVLNSCLYQLQVPPLISFLGDAYGGLYGMYTNQYPIMSYTHPPMPNYYYLPPVQIHLNPPMYSQPIDSMAYTTTIPPTTTLNTISNDVPIAFNPPKSPVLSENDQELSFSSKSATSFGMICSPRHRTEAIGTPPETEQVLYKFSNELLLDDFDHNFGSSTFTHKNDGIHRLHFENLLRNDPPQSTSSSSEPSTSSEANSDNEVASSTSSSPHSIKNKDEPAITTTTTPPKRRYLYDAPTPLEIQKQSLQIHVQNEAISDINPDELRRATVTWIDNMKEQGHTFDEKAALKFHELIATDPYRAVGITVSFDLRKDTIQNKSAWLSRACFNCQRKIHPTNKALRKAVRGKTKVRSNN
ncbi:hypothetical protein THRCLA_00186 [Thraustotheca clavata]|uniref:Uncharacterized protein n=1 Tax=Thraustotheca clavata TaxID=74557 RepID=A0A1W0AC77_9STRA|nr:hypothetical protein THRCLA_00186 [Thraustotheca clavata]